MIHNPLGICLIVEIINAFYVLCEHGGNYRVVSKIMEGKCERQKYKIPFTSRMGANKQVMRGKGAM